MSRSFSGRFGAVLLAGLAGISVGGATPTRAATVGGIELGGLTDYLFVFTDASQDANWQSSSRGYIGDIAIAGGASFRTSGSFAYAGTVRTDGASLGAWQRIINNNPGQAAVSVDQDPTLAGLTADLHNAFAQINALAPTPGFASRSASSLDGLNTQNNIPETVVINVTSGFQVSTTITITGDPADAFILRWDTDANPANGYNGQVKFQSGGAIVPRGGLSARNFVHAAGDLNASGGGNAPPAPYPQGPRANAGLGALINGASDFGGGGFFTGYWLTTGNPSTRDTSPFSNAIFVGGWYSTTDKFSMTSGTSGVHVTLRCPADLDDGSGTGTPDGGVTLDDFLYFLSIFEAGDPRADLDDGSGLGIPDGGVTIEDYLYFAMRFKEIGC